MDNCGSLMILLMLEMLHDLCILNAHSSQGKVLRVMQNVDYLAQSQLVHLLCHYWVISLYTPLKGPNVGDLRFLQ